MVVAPPLVEQVYEAIIEDICTGVFPGGTQLRQEDLAARLGVSRQPVQQAMVLLKRHGLVRDSSRRGLEVVPLDAQFVNDLYDMRLLLDTHATETTTPRFVDESVRERALECVHRGQEAFEQRLLYELVAADAEFHGLFYALTENPFLIETATRLSQSIRRVMTEVLARGGVPRWVWDEHHLILEAVLDGDARLARRRAHEHVEHGRTMMLDALNEPPPPADS